ncbi:MAG: RCC1 repeat- and reductase domain-containing protein, partial [Chloroflexi bacterium]|nr:RCC1 repeat- and reductase domain-containing protein [Chloroflexota bacterium]
LLGDGTVWAWGSNYSGGLGDGTLTDRHGPVQVAGLTDATTIAAGLDSSLAITSDGGVWAWGANHFGQLGDGSTDDSTAPVPVSGLLGSSALAAGLHSLALGGIAGD